MTGGGIVRVPAGNRIEIPATDAGLKAPPGQASKISTVEVFEAGLWMLNDPDGSILLSGMRGPEGQEWNEQGLGSDLLSPRYETIAEARPAFHWSGQGTARVVVARARQRDRVAQPASFTGNGDLSAGRVAAGARPGLSLVARAGRWRRSPRREDPIPHGIETGGARRQMRLDEEAAELLIDMRGKIRAPAPPDAAGRRATRP